MTVSDDLKNLKDGLDAFVLELRAIEERNLEAYRAAEMADNPGLMDDVKKSLEETHYAYDFYMVSAAMGDEVENDTKHPNAPAKLNTAIDIFADARAELDQETTGVYSLLGEIEKTTDRNLEIKL